MRRNNPHILVEQDAGSRLSFVTLKIELFNRLSGNVFQHVITVLPHIDPSRVTIKIFSILNRRIEREKVIHGFNIANGFCHLSRL